MKTIDIMKSAGFKNGYRMGYSNERCAQIGTANRIPAPRSSDNPLFARGFIAGHSDAKQGVDDATYRRFGQEG